MKKSLDKSLKNSDEIKAYHLDSTAINIAYFTSTFLLSTNSYKFICTVKIIFGMTMHDYMSGTLLNPSWTLSVKTPHTECLELGKVVAQIAGYAISSAFTFC